MWSFSVCVTNFDLRSSYRALYKYNIEKLYLQMSVIHPPDHHQANSDFVQIVTIYTGKGGFILEQRLQWLIDAATSH